LGTIVMVYAADSNRDGTLERSTMYRCRKAARFIQQSDSYRILLTAGYSKEFLKGSPLVGSLTLAQAMEEYFVNELEVPRERIDRNAPSVVTNTWTETVAAEEYCSKQDEILAISAWYHLPRIWLCWRLLGGRVKLIPARARLNNIISSLAHEIIGISYYLCRYGIQKATG